MVSKKTVLLITVLFSHIWDCKANNESVLNYENLSNDSEGLVDYSNQLKDEMEIGSDTRDSSSYVGGGRQLQFDELHRPTSNIMDYMRRNQQIGNGVSQDDLRNNVSKFWEDLDESGKKHIIYPSNITNDNKDVQYINIDSGNPNKKIRTVASQKQRLGKGQLDEDIKSLRNLLTLQKNLSSDLNRTVTCPDGFEVATEDENGETHRWNGKMERSVCIRCPYRYDIDVRPYVKIYSELTLTPDGKYICVWDHSMEKMEILVEDDARINATSIAKQVNLDETVDVPQYDDESPVDPNDCSWGNKDNWEDVKQYVAKRGYGRGTFSWHSEDKMKFDGDSKSVFSQFIDVVTVDEDTGDIVPRVTTSSWPNWPEYFQQQDISYMTKHCSANINYLTGEFAGSSSKCQADIADKWKGKTLENYIANFNAGELAKKFYKCRCKYEEIPFAKLAFYKRKKQDLERHYNEFLVDEYDNVTCGIKIESTHLKPFCGEQGQLHRTTDNGFKCTWKDDVEKEHSTTTSQMQFKYATEDYVE